MHIKQLEKLLSVSRANIRFYEKEGLISPERKTNNYRDFSARDISELEKIIILRKLGLSIREISMIQHGELSLGAAAEKNAARLEKELKELRDAVEISQRIAADNIEYEALDIEKYSNIISERETHGGKFKDICHDCIVFEISMFDDMWKRVFLHDFEDSRKRHGVLIAVLILIAICIVRGISNKYLWHGTFFQGFFYPLGVFFIGSLILLPLYLLSKISPKLAGIASGVVLFIALLILALIIIGIPLLIANYFYHFMF